MCEPYHPAHGQIRTESGLPAHGADVQRRIGPSALEAFCRTYGVKRLSLFGSTLQGTAGADSDVDLLVEFEPGRTPGLLTIATMEAELATHFAGRRVDLRTAADLSRYFRDDVVRNAALLHER